MLTPDLRPKPYSHSDGVVIFPTSSGNGSSELNPRISLLKSNGSTLYLTRSVFIDLFVDLTITIYFLHPCGIAYHASPMLNSPCGWKH